MAEFELNMNARKGHAWHALDDFAKGYVEAMFFTNGDTGDSNEWRLNEMGVDRLTRASVETIAHDCAKFVEEAGELLTEVLDNGRIRGYDEASAGRDFWYARQGHGTGFRDREEIDPAQAEVLAIQADGFGEAYVSVWWGWIHYA